MVDFVRMNYNDKSVVEDFICNSKNFPELRVILEKHSGVIEYPYKTKLESMDITITEKKVCIMNSIHKLNNYRKHRVNRNHDDFKYSEIIENINFIESRLINIEKATLSKLEFGLNIEIDFPAKFIIRNNIMMHKKKIHNHNKKFEGRGELKQFDHSNYDFKIYDKAKQYNLPRNVIRFEIKHKRSKSFNPYGIHNILDLTSKENLKMLFENLIHRFEELTIIDNYRDNPNIPEEVKNEIEQYTSYNFWETLSDRKFRNKKPELKKRFKQVLDENNLLTIKSDLRNKLKAKFEYLINN